MSYFVTLDGKYAADFATNSGWFDFADHLRKHGGDELRTLADEGFSEDLDALAGELADLLSAGGMDSGQLEIAEGLAKVLEGRGEAVILVVSDGAGGEGEGDDDDEPAGRLT